MELLESYGTLESYQVFGGASVVIWRFWSLVAPLEPYGAFIGAFRSLFSPLESYGIF